MKNYPIPPRNIEVYPGDTYKHLSFEFQPPLLGLLVDFSSENIRLVDGVLYMFRSTAADLPIYSLDLKTGIFQQYGKYPVNIPLTPSQVEQIKNIAKPSEPLKPLTPPKPLTPLNWALMGEDTLKTAFSAHDLSAQYAFFESLTPTEVALLDSYKEDSSRFTLQGSRNFLSTSEAPENNPAHPGLTKQEWALMKGMISRAPALTQKLSVYRGVDKKEAMNISGKNVVSTSVNQRVANRFKTETRECCMLKITIEPGVRVIAVDECYRTSVPGLCREAEVIVCPPFTFRITGGDENEKQATISPGVPKGGRRRTKRHKRKSRRRV